MYIGSWDYSVWARDGTTGKLRWVTRTGNWVDATAALSPDAATLSIGSLDDKLYALNAATGDVIWESALPSFLDASPTVTSADMVILGCGDGNLYALNAKGAQVWNVTLGGYVWSTAALSHDESVAYVASTNGVIAAVNTSDGKLAWSVTAAAAVVCSPVVDGHGVVFIGAMDGNVYAIAPDGTLIHTHFLGGYVNALIIPRDGALLVGTYSNKGNQSYHWLQ